MYYVLVVGAVASSALYALGIALLVLENQASTSIPAMSPSGFVSDLAAGRPVAVLALATIVLIGTPITRVLVSVIVFALNRERRFVLVTSVVFAVMMTSLAVGLLFNIRLA